MRYIGRISGQFHVEGKTTEYAEKDGVVYKRVLDERVWRVSHRLPPPTEEGKGDSG